MRRLTPCLLPMRKRSELGQVTPRQDESGDRQLSPRWNSLRPGLRLQALHRIPLLD